jgi:hypothetical protein
MGATDLIRKMVIAAMDRMELTARPIAGPVEGGQRRDKLWGAEVAVVDVDSGGSEDGSCRRMEAVRGPVPPENTSSMTQIRSKTYGHSTVEGISCLSLCTREARASPSSS